MCDPILETLVTIQTHLVQKTKIVLKTKKHALDASHEKLLARTAP